MEGNRLEQEIKSLMNLGYTTLISQHSKDIEEFKTQSSKFQKILKLTSNDVKQHLHFNCPECNNPMKRNISLTTHKIYWFCKCYGHSFDTLELIHIINRKKRR